MKRKMARIAAFLKPTTIKLVFILEWSVFILATWSRGELETPHQALVIAYPLIFFYLAGCALSSLSQRFRGVAQGWRLIALALGLALIDQGIKLMVSLRIPYQTSIPIVNNWLHLAHEHNPYGSWVGGAFFPQFENFLHWMQWGLALLVLVASIFWHQIYITRWRESLWADVAFLGIFSGYASWIWDMAARGYILDFINLP